MLLTALFRNAGFLGGRLDFAIALTALEGAWSFKAVEEAVGVGVALGAFLVKKLLIDLCPDAGAVPDFWEEGVARAGGAGVAVADFGLPISTAEQCADSVLWYTTSRSV